MWPQQLRHWHHLQLHLDCSLDICGTDGIYWALLHLCAVSALCLLQHAVWKQAAWILPLQAQMLQPVVMHTQHMLVLLLASSCW